MPNRSPTARRYRPGWPDAKRKKTSRTRGPFGATDGAWLLSALASIGLTVPVVVPASIVFDLPLVLGLEPKDLAMPALTFVVSAITLGTGRTYMKRGAVHLVLFAAFGFLVFVP